MRTTIWWLALVGCGGGAEEETAAPGASTTQGFCGDVHNDVPVRVEGQVLLADGVTPAEGAIVTLDERSWTFFQVFGEATTGADGRFAIDADIIVVDGCWGSAIAYYLTAERDGIVVERGINSWLFNAVEGTGSGGGDGVAEVAIPLVLGGTTTSTTPY